MSDRTYGPEEKAKLERLVKVDSKIRKYHFNFCLEKVCCQKN